MRLESWGSLPEAKQSLQLRTCRHAASTTCLLGEQLQQERRLLPASRLACLGVRRRQGWLPFCWRCLHHGVCQCLILFLRGMSPQAARWGSARAAL